MPTINLTDHLKDYITVTPRYLAPHSLKGRWYQDSRQKVPATVQMTAVRFSPLAYVNKLEVLVEDPNILEHGLCSFSVFQIGELTLSSASSNPGTVATVGETGCVVCM
jgi:hypothetical protein